MNNNQIRCSIERLIEIQTEAGTKAANIFCYFVAWTHQEVEDPSNPTKRLGIVQPELNAQSIRELTDSLMSKVTGGRVSAKSFEYGRKNLSEEGFIAQLRLSHGQRIVVRDSQKFLFRDYKVNKPPLWVFEMEEFAAFKPHSYPPALSEKSSPKSWDHHATEDESSLKIQDVIPKNSGSSPKISGSFDVNSGSLAPEHIKNEQLTSLGSIRKYEEEEQEVKQPLSPSLLNQNLGQNQVEYDELARELRQARNERLSILARFNNPAPDRSKKQATALVNKLIKKATQAGCPGSTSAKNSETVEIVMQNQGADDAVWFKALELMIANAKSVDGESRSAFNLGHVCSRMGGTLPALLDEARILVRDSLLSPVHQTIGRCEGRQNVLIEQARREAEEKAESELIEQTLPA